MNKTTTLLIFSAIFFFLFSSCQKEPQPQNQSNDNVVLHDNVYVVDSSELILVSTIQEKLAGTYKFSYTGEEPNITVGDVIVGSEGEGFLREVTAKSSTSNQVTLQTTQATMEDLFKSGDIDFQMDLNTSDQFRNNSLRHDMPSFTFYNQNGITLDASGFLEFSYGLDFDFSFKNGNIDEILFQTQNTRATASLTVSASASQTLQLLNRVDTLAGYQKTYTKWVTAGVFPVPIVVVVTTNFLLKYGAEIDAATNASITATNNNLIELGAHYKNGSWTGINSFTPDFDLDLTLPNGSVGATLSASLVPRIDVKFYGVGGPYASVGLRSALKGNIASPSLDWDISSCLWMEATAGANITIFGKNLVDFSRTWSSDTLLAQTPYEISKVSGDSQSTFPNQSLPDLIRVRVFDTDSVPQSGVPVYFSAIGGGNVSATSLLTDQYGNAEVIWTLGGSGIQNLYATAKKANGTDIHMGPVVFTATLSNTLPQPTTLIYTGGNNQNGNINQQLANSLKVQIQDQYGNPYPGETVTFNVVSGGGSVSNATVSSNSNGYAETYWTLGNTIGNQSIEAYANVLNGSPLTFTATATYNPVATTLVYISGNNQSGNINQQLANSLKVQVQDQYGNPYSGETVTFNVVSGGGSLNTSALNTNINGYAEAFWILGNTIGNQTVEVSTSVLNGSPLTFAATGHSIFSTFTDYRDGEVYATVAIGNKVWMAENLRYNTVGSFLNTNNPNSIYGRLYDWNMALTACPNGWHLPNDSEWNDMEIALGMSPIDTNIVSSYRGTHALSMKSTTGWFSSNGNGTNTSGFNAFPAGNYGDYNPGSFWYLTNSAIFWSATEYSASNASYLVLHYSSSGSARGNGSKTIGNSCRCVQD